MKKSNNTNNHSLHPLNRHFKGYDFDLLTTANPLLTPFVFQNKYGNQTINFHLPQAVKALNQALLYQHHSIQFWDIPENYLCPPIPGRLDYIHHIADLLQQKNNNKIPFGNNIYGLDIGMGDNCIYPMTFRISMVFCRI